MITLTLEQFTEQIEKIKLYMEVDSEVNESLRKLKDDFMSFSLGELVQSILDLLIILFEDDENYWITYWMYDLDFGSRNNEMKVYDENEKEIPLSTIEDLYNLLIDNLKEK